MADNNVRDFFALVAYTNKPSVPRGWSLFIKSTVISSRTTRATPSEARFVGTIAYLTALPVISG